MSSNLKTLFEELPTTQTLHALTHAMMAPVVSGMSDTVVATQRVWFAQFQQSIIQDPGSPRMSVWARGAGDWHSVVAMRSAISRSMRPAADDDMDEDPEDCAKMLDTIDRALDHALNGVDRFGLYASCR